MFSPEFTHRHAAAISSPPRVLVPTVGTPSLVQKLELTLLGANANLENIYDMLGENMTASEASPHDGSSPYVSVCYVGMNMALKGHEVAACCDSVSLPDPHSFLISFLTFTGIL